MKYNPRMRSDLIAQLSSDALRHNFAALRAAAPGARICVPLKADSYGHGSRLVAPILQQAGADFAAVATVSEGVELRETGWKGDILVLGNVLAIDDAAERRERLDAIREHRMALTIVDETALQHIADARLHMPISVHLKIDTGMGRMGVTPQNALPLLRKVLDAGPGVQLEGVYSHFATADFDEMDLVQAQLKTFARLMSEADELMPRGTLRHLANSAATIMLPEAHYDMVRPGLAMYGYYPATHMAELIKLQPCLRLTSHLTMVKDLPTGHCVGYAQTFITKRPTRLGIIPCGYFDGFVRSLSNNAMVGTSFGDAPVIGRISMDQMAVDLTELRGVGVGTEVVLIDNDPRRPNSVQRIAERMDTIPYEVTCLLSGRIQRVVV